MKLWFFAIFWATVLQLTPLQARASELSESPLEDALSFKKNPIQWDIPRFGAIDVRAIATGIGSAQTNPLPNDYNSFVDISNAQIILKRDTGFIQLYLQGGMYSTPSLGTTYQRASQQTQDSFGYIPLASLSLAPSKNLLFTGGKINSFGGAENTFTFQNGNIDRGLLWNQTSNVSRGFQASYSKEALSTEITLNDGFYSNQLSWMGAAVNYKINPKNSAGLVWAGAIKSNNTDTFITPVAQNNSQIVNAIYTYKSQNWSLTPYLQYTYVPSNASLGLYANASTTGAAVLANYRFRNNRPGTYTLPFRVEYITSSGKGNPNAPNLLYGPGSAAWSATITPTYQYERVFIRGEFSYVQLVNSSSGFAFGSTGSTTNQTRVMIETGILY
jgi:hypothetical protein